MAEANLSNPYAPPPAIEETTADLELANESKTCFVFETDCSPESLAKRRSRKWWPFFDLAFGIFSLMTLIDFGYTLSPANVGYGRYPGLACLMIPAWIAFGAIWLSQFPFRNGTDFRSRTPGLAGRLKGIAQGRRTFLVGPVSILAYFRSSPWNGLYKLRFTPPGAVEIRLDHTEVDDLDSPEGIPTDLDPESVYQLYCHMMNQQPDESRLCQEGELIVRDLRGRYLKAYWKLILAVGFIVMVGSLIWSIHTYRSMPTYVWQYEGYYLRQPGFGDALLKMYACLILSPLIFGLFVLFLWSELRKLGTFSVVISPHCLLVQKHGVDKSVAGLHGDAISQIRVNDRHLDILGPKRRLWLFRQPLMAIPLHWFTEAEQEQIRRWFPDRSDERANRIETNFYLGPTL